MATPASVALLGPPMAVAAAALSTNVAAAADPELTREESPSDGEGGAAVPAGARLCLVRRPLRGCVDFFFQVVPGAT